MDKQLLKYVGILVGLLFIVIIFLIIFNGGSGKHTYTYDKIEEKMVKAAKNYVADKKKLNIDVLPDSPYSDPTELTANQLANDGYMKSLSEYVADDVKCVGSVKIYNAGNNKYDYVPELDCGVKHQSMKLADKVIEDNEGGTTIGSGLYQRINGEFIVDDRELNMFNSDDYEYVFRGDDVNNFIKIDDNLWRIVSIDSENNMLLIFNSRAQKATVWDDRYNEEIAKYQGINNYEDNGLESSIYKTLKEFYNGTLTLDSREELSEKMYHYMVPMDLCIGKRSEQDEDISGKLECSVILEDQYVGLLPAYYFMSASLDPNCNTLTSKSCGNYNYLTEFDDYWWLLTADSESSNSVYNVETNYVELSLCSYKSSVKPTIMLGSRAVFQEGDGSLDNPYQIKYYNE